MINGVFKLKKKVVKQKFKGVLDDFVLLSSSDSDLSLIIFDVSSFSDIDLIFLQFDRLYVGIVFRGRNSKNSLDILVVLFLQFLFFLMGMQIVILLVQYGFCSVNCIIKV